MALVSKDDVSDILKGTTTISIIGADFVVAVADGRQTGSNDDVKGVIRSGKAKKMFEINDYIAGVISGHVIEGQDLVKKAQQAVREDNEIEKAQKACQMYVDEWKARLDNSDKKFPAKITLIGYNHLGMIIYVIGSKNGTKTVTGKNVVVATGKGKRYAREYVEEYLNSRKDRELTVDKYLDLLTEGVVVACTHGSFSGGLFRAMILHRNDKVKISKFPHVVNILSGFNLGYYLSQSFICVSKDIGYTYEHERDLEDRFRRTSNKIESYQVLGVKSKLIVRLIRFSSTVDRDATYQTLHGAKKWKEYELLIPRDDVIESLGKEFESINHKSKDFL